MIENTQRDAPKSKRKKHIILLVIGILMTLMAEGLALRNPSAYTAGTLAVIFLSRPIIYFVVLGVIALIVAAARRSVRRCWFPMLAWLFLAAGLFDIAAKSYTELVLRPKIDKSIEELVRAGRLPGLGDVNAGREV